jgi:hypothetical protein
MDWVVKLSLIGLIVLLVGAIVVYHMWLDRLIARERGQAPASAPAPEPEPSRVEAPAPAPGRARRSA